MCGKIYCLSKDSAVGYIWPHLERTQNQTYLMFVCNVHVTSRGQLWHIFDTCGYRYTAHFRSHVHLLVLSLAVFNKKLYLTSHMLTYLVFSTFSSTIASSY